MNHDQIMTAADLALRSDFYSLHGMTPEDFASNPARVMIRILALIDQQIQMQKKHDRVKAALLKLQEVVSVCRWCGNRSDLPEPIDPTPATQIRR